MDIIIPFGILHRELEGEVSDEAQKIFEKNKQRPDLAIGLPTKGLPERMTFEGLCHNLQRSPPPTLLLSPLAATA